MDILDNKSNLIKKLIYRSCNRGCKETDLILGKYALNNLNNLTDDELIEYEAFLNETDNDIYSWMTGKLPLPTYYQNSKIITAIFSYECDDKS